MTKWSSIFLMIFTLSGCTEKNPIPANIITPNKMEDILWDLIRADQYLSTYVFPNDSSIDKKTTSINLYQQVFTIHKVDKKEFQKSFDYYTAHPELLLTMMDSLQRKPLYPEYEKKKISDDTVHSTGKEIEFRKSDTLIPKNRLKKVIPD